ncbi:MAG: DUF3098 domain-containing protein [Flammeovirgaceae bacterium]|jgi:uncharacterized membrane protein|nr:DUF3098 domain-containing protein [Flammeovirgaceae bacterium]
MSVQTKFAFKKINYLIMILGIALILLGFLTMSLDQETYGFGFLGLTLGPIIVFSGFMIQFVAILYKSKKATN